MSQELSAGDIGRVHAVIAQSELRGIFFHEMSARRLEEPSQDIAENAANIEVNVQHRIAEDSFGIRLQGIVRTHIGEATVSVSCEYDLTDGFNPTKRDVLMFANEVAVMTVFPYLREGFSDVTTKVFGEPVLLPIAQRGQIAFDLDTTNEA